MNPTPPSTRERMAEEYADACIPRGHDMWRVMYLAHIAGWSAALKHDESVLKDRAEIESLRAQVALLREALTGPLEKQRSGLAKADTLAKGRAE